jgi:hypothetical protein
MGTFFLTKFGHINARWTETTARTVKLLLLQASDVRNYIVGIRP